MNEQQLVVGAIIVDDPTAPSMLLAARRTAPSALRGQWEFPGGKVEPGETPGAALIRELTEELGVTIRLGEELSGPVDGHWPISDRFRMRLWFAVITGGTPTPNGSHDAVRWLELTDLPELTWVSADQPVVRALRDRFGPAPIPHLRQR